MLVLVPRPALAAAVAFALVACRGHRREHTERSDADADTAAAARAEDIALAAAADAHVFPPPPDGWVDIATAIPDAVIDLHYATTHNFTRTVLYPAARCLLRAPVAAHLAAAADTLRPAGLRLVLWDCYRPSSVQRALWEHAPDQRFVAPPGQGSNHSRGAAVDVSLADARGVPVVMPTEHDDFTRAASGAAAIGDARKNLVVLRRAMVGAGFRTIPTEWWHFDDARAGDHALSDQPLE